jgi:hypothetical protein
LTASRALWGAQAVIYLVAMRDQEYFSSRFRTLRLNEQSAWVIPFALWLDY